MISHRGRRGFKTAGGPFFLPKTPSVPRTRGLIPCAVLLIAGVGLAVSGCKERPESAPASPTPTTAPREKRPAESALPSATPHSTPTLPPQATPSPPRAQSPPARQRTPGTPDPNDLVRRCQEIGMPPPPGVETLPDDMLRNLRDKIEAVAQNPTADNIGELGCLYHALARNRADSDNAVTCYEKAKALAPDSGVWPYFLGWAFYTRESLERARGEFLTALANRPELYRAHFWLGETELSRKVGSEARKHFQDYIEKVPEIADGYVGLAEAELLEKNNTAAFAAIQKALHYDPDCGRAHRALSAYYTRAGEAADAAKERALARSLPLLHGRLRNDPLELKLWRSCGATRYSIFQMNQIARAGDLDSAVLLGEALIADHPDAAPLLVGVARVFAKIGRGKEAGDLARRAQKATPYAPALELLSHLAWRDGDFEDAKRLADRAIAADPDYAGGYGARGNAQRSLQKPAAALEDMLHAAQLDPKGARYLRVAGEILLAQGRKAEAKKRFLQALEIGERLNPFPASLVPVLMTVANMQVEEGDSEAAIRSLDRVLQFNPSYEPAFRQLAEILFSVGRGPDAIKYCRNLMKHSPQSLGYPLLLAELLDRADQTVKAMQRLAQIERRMPKHAGVPFTRAVLLLRHGKTSQAQEELKKAIALNPKFERAYMLLVSTLLKANQPTDVVTVLRQGLENLPDSPMIHNTLAWILATGHDAALRDPAQALELSQQACQLLSKKNANFLDTLACAQAATGDFASAQRSEQEAIDLAPTPEAKQDFTARLELFKKNQAYVQGE